MTSTQFEPQQGINSWPYSDVAPVSVDPMASCLLPPSLEAVAVSATPSTVSIWVNQAPSSAKIGMWEKITGRTVAITLTSTETLTGLVTRTQDQNSGQALLDTLLDELLSQGIDVNSLVEGTNYPRLQTILIRANTKIRVKQNNLWSDLLSGESTPEFVDMLATRLCGGALFATLSISENLRWSVRYVPRTLLVIIPQPASMVGPDRAWLPEVSSSLIKPGSGLVVIASVPSGGKSVLAWALGAYGAGRQNTQPAIISPNLCWEKGLDPAWSCYTIKEDSEVKDLTSALLAAKTGLFIFDGFNDNKVVLRVVNDVAKAGALVIYTTLATDLAMVLDMVVENNLSRVLRGAICRTLLPAASDTGLVLSVVDEAIVISDQMRSQLLLGQFTQVEQLAEIGGSSLGVSFDTSLARAVSAGRIGADVASMWVRTPAKYAAATGRIGQLTDLPIPASISEEDWGWSNEKTD